MIKRIFVTLLMVHLAVGALMAQATLSSKEMVAISPVVCKAMTLDTNSKRMLNMKLQQVVAANGFGSTSYRYALVPNIVVVNKRVAQTVPAMYSIEFELSLYVVDTKEDVVINETSFALKGMDRVEGRAYASAINQLNPRSPQVKVFMERSRGLILDYYTTRTVSLLKKAESLAARERYDEAMAVLSPIPESVDEYSQVADALVAIYNKKVDKEAQSLLLKSKGMLGEEKFSEAIAALGEIDPSSNYWGKANRAMDGVVKAIEEKKREALEVEKMKLESQIALAKEMTEQKKLEVKELEARAAAQPAVTAQVQKQKIVDKARDVNVEAGAKDDFVAKVNAWYESLPNEVK